eukprot:TRINITY_DN595_c0_g1_i4.p1 TRINITY_DN595_c0_g1~~TRINITY_DN595_c0_g1_i4.p1  ORF type:complete len:130 (-),score=18.39 TRINITY_DN595_c0_g1_i4:316-705(-)
MKKVKRGKKPEVKSTPECKVSKAPVAYEDSVLSKYSDSPSGISPEGLLALCKDADLNMHSDVPSLLNSGCSTCPPLRLWKQEIRRDIEGGVKGGTEQVGNKNSNAMERTVRPCVRLGRRSCVKYAVKAI